MAKKKAAVEAQVVEDAIVEVVETVETVVNETVETEAIEAEVGPIETEVIEAVETATIDTAVGPVEVEEPKKLGRKINPTSDRQKRLAARQALIDSGVVVERGRKPNSESERQKRLMAWEAKRAAGLEVKRGRPKGQTNQIKPEKANELLAELNELNLDPVADATEVMEPVEA